MEYCSMLGEVKRLPDSSFRRAPNKTIMMSSLRFCPGDPVGG